MRAALPVRTVYRPGGMAANKEPFFIFATERPLTVTISADRVGVSRCLYTKNQSDRAAVALGRNRAVVTNAQQDRRQCAEVSRS